MREDEEKKKKKQKEIQDLNVTNQPAFYRFKALSYQLLTEHQCLLFGKLLISIFNWGFSLKVTSVFLLQKNNVRIIRIKHYSS